MLVLAEEVLLQVLVLTDLIALNEVVPPSRGGAFSRGRGGGGNNRGSFEAPYGQGLYDQGSPTGDVGAGPYSNYNAGPPQDPFFQNGYGGGAPPQFGAPPIAAQPPLAGAYNQGYGSFEGALEN